jgi:hypothetical protein
MSPGSLPRGIPPNLSMRPTMRMLIPAIMSSEPIFFIAGGLYCKRKIMSTGTSGMISFIIYRLGETGGLFSGNTILLHDKDHRL